MSNGNDVTAEEDKEIIGVYTMRLKGVALPLLHYTMVPGIQSGHLTAHNFITYLIQRTWIGKSFVRYDLDGQPEEINFIPLLIPSIKRYSPLGMATPFSQREIMLEHLNFNFLATSVWLKPIAVR